MSLVSKAVQSAKSVLKRVPGSGILRKSEAQTEDTLDSKSVAKLFEAEQKDFSVIDNAPVEMSPEELEKVCNISRLRERHRCLMRGQLPAIFEGGDLQKSEYTRTYRYQRKMFARYGSASGVDPRKIWPSEEEIRTAKIVNGLKFTMTVEDLLNKVQSHTERKAYYEAKNRERDDKIAANMVVMEKMKEKMYADALKTEEELNVLEEKRNMRIEKVRRYFQYTLSVTDPRFREKMSEMITNEKQALKTLSKEEKKKAKEANQARKEAAAIAAMKAKHEAKAKAKAQAAGGDVDD